MDVIWFDRGEKAIEKMRSYADCSTWNFQNKLLCCKLSSRYYDAAILSAKEHKFVHEEALTCELAGHFMLESGEGRAAFPYFLLAQKKYGEWGAYAKEESLETYINYEEQFGTETTTETNISPGIPAEPDLRKRRAS
eukprot:scaffold2390_cov81-Skeletonema_marinoi.AAC.1